MKLFIERSEIFEEAEIHIKCRNIDKNLQQIIDEIQDRIQYGIFSLKGMKENKVYHLELGEIYYFECVDNKTFAYGEKEVFQCSYKLYELEEKISNLSFARISKSVIANITKIEYMKPQLNGRFEAVFLNGEKQIVNRYYVKQLRKKFEGGEEK